MAEHPSRGDRTALLVVDMLNPYDHEDADKLAQSVAAVVPQVSRLIERARDVDVPVVWVNDNYGGGVPVGTACSSPLRSSTT